MQERVIQGRVMSVWTAVCPYFCHVFGCEVPTECFVGPQAVAPDLYQAKRQGSDHKASNHPSPIVCSRTCPLPEGHRTTELVGSQDLGRERAT